MKKLGVIGGLGPMATAYFMKLVIEMTDASADQEHIEMLIHNCPGIPDRTSYILGQSKENPVKQMISIGKKLAENGAQIIAIPCMTASCFQRELQEAVPIPIIDVIHEIGKELSKKGIGKAGVMATDGMIQSQLFQQELKKMGIQTVLPEPERQKDVMHLIYKNVKAGKTPEQERFLQIARSLQEKGAQVIVLGCSELSMIPREEQRDICYLDGMQILARCSVEACGKLKKEYQDDK